MSFKLKFKMLPNEYWYGADVNSGWRLPMHSGTIGLYDTTLITSYNQANTVWVSSKGRYIWSDEGYKASFKAGTVTCKSKTAEIKLYDGFENLRGAFLAASAAHFPPDGKRPNDMMIKAPQYCTWIHLSTNQNQKDILEFAKEIIDCGMTPGEMLIDDGWQRNFGDWHFREEAFPDPKKMIEELHEMGFKVLMWICPFVSKEAPDFNYLAENNMLVRNLFGNIAERKWWDGKDPLLDLSNPASVKWFKDVAERLFNELGVDGLKQDAGDAYFYKNSDKTFVPSTTANDQSYLWAETAREYEYNELRACFKGGGWGVTQRLSDKSHRWKLNGLSTLIPNAITQGLTGYPFSCPDMVGGGEISSFKNQSDKNSVIYDIDKDESEFDVELLVRWAQCSALMPMMQYSFALWKLKNEKARKICVDVSKIHEKYADTILALADNAAKTGEPIVRHPAYVYPDCGYEKVKDIFFLGNDILVAPVIKKGAVTKTLMIPDGKWKYIPTGEIYTKGEVTVDAPLEILPIFEKIK